MARSGDSKDNTAAIAAKFGVSPKALRLYEQLGMLVPPRNRVGWRVYGEAENVRLNAILTLKKLGLTITRIAQLLKTSGDDLDAILADQEAALHRRRRETHMAINLVRVSRAGLQRGTIATPEELAAILRRNMTLFPITPELEIKTRKAFLPEQMSVLHVTRLDDQTLLNMTEGWLRVHSDVAKLMDIGDPTSAAALDVARRTDELIRLMTNNDEDIMARATKFWADALNDPETASLLPLTKPQWEFLHKALAEFRRKRKAKK